MPEYTRTSRYAGLLPAAVATGAWLATGAVLDVYLVANNKRPITDVLRTIPGGLFLTVLCLHVVNKLGKVDPFCAVSGVVQSRYCQPQVALADQLENSK